MSLGIVFITGQSNPKSCSLSPLQVSFAQPLVRAGGKLHKTNFPYDKQMEAFSPVNIIKASYHNYGAFRSSKRACFAERYSGYVDALFVEYSQVLFLAGSCGLELLNNLSFSKDLQSRMSVLAYGPVTRKPRCASAVQFPVTIVKGRYDLISRLSHHKADYIVGCGHLSYLANSAFQAFALAHVEALLRDMKKGHA
ncbi:hypothetical protein [Agaribacterium sp. ZY112]|uniref:hypothetical protein n=1 Tax=Agaribacterium sp. ZY112 TaxID=3233574 RepID=UPI003524DD30